MADDTVAPEVISRKEAKARGLLFYFTGRACHKGHIAARYVVNWWCLECRLLAEQNPENRKAKRERSSRYRIEHPDRVAAANKKWALANKERVAASRDRWQAQNPQKVKQYQKTSRARNRERRLAQAREWRIANPQRRLEVYRQWCAENRSRIRALWNARRARKINAEGRFTAEDVARIKKGQRGLCAICRKRLLESYHCDHIVALASGGSNWPRNIQLLCQPCNNRKHAKDPIDFARELGLLL